MRARAFYTGAVVGFQTLRQCHVVDVHTGLWFLYTIRAQAVIYWCSCGF
jgi:hypothetical protein